MNGPVAMRVPLNPTRLDLLMAGAETPAPALLPEYLRMAKETGPCRKVRIQDEQAAFAEERLLAQTRGSVEELRVKFSLELQKTRIPSWDEYLDNITACDSLALSERLRPLEYHVTFITDAKDRLEVRIRAARLRRLEATLERCKIEALESQLLCAISVLKTETAMATIREQEGGAVVFGKRSEMLHQAALEAMRQVGVAEDALRQERNAQLAAEQTRMAQGTITRADAASAIPAFQRKSTT
jgi:hypothetical protein